MATSLETQVSYVIFNPNKLNIASMRLEIGPYLVQRLQNSRLDI